MRLTDSAFLSPRRRLGALPPQPAWCGMMTAMRSSNAPANKRGLAEPRMADGDDLARVDVRIGDEIIDDARIAPRPGGDRAPVIGVLLVEELLHPLAHVLAVGIDVAGVEGRHGIAAIDGGLDVPDVVLGAASWRRWRDCP